jgi:hypothetical protein
MLEQLRCSVQIFLLFHSMDIGYTGGPIILIPCVLCTVYACTMYIITCHIACIFKTNDQINVAGTLLLAAPQTPIQGSINKPEKCDRICLFL